MTRSELQRFVRKTLGGAGRVWYRAGGVEIGTEMDGRRNVMGRGATPAEAVRHLYDQTRKAAGLSPRLEAPRLSAWARFIVFVRALFTRRKALGA